MEKLLASFTNNTNGFLSPEILGKAFRSSLILLIGISLLYFLARIIRSYITQNFSAQRGMIVSKIVQYSGLVLVFIMILNEWDFKLTPLLGTAGIIGIAVGFASQTSISNIISGIFLMTEQPFVVNDIIRVEETVGVVLSIDILSVKLRTFENQFIRIPNETILKSKVITLTRYPIRRIDIQLSVAYKEELDRVKKILTDIAHNNPLCLQEPEPLILFEGFNSSSVDLKFAVWSTREDWLTLKNEMYLNIKKRFDQEGIEFPFPHLSLYTGSASRPLQVEVRHPVPPPE